MTLTIFSYDGDSTIEIGAITLSDGEVTTTGVGADRATIPVFDHDRATDRRLGPRDGRPWLEALARELERSGYFLTTLTD